MLNDKYLSKLSKRYLINIEKQRELFLKEGFIYVN